MAKDVLVVKCNKDIPFDEWDDVVRYIGSQVDNKYYVVGLLKGMEIECVTDEAKVFNIDGDNYSCQAIKEAIKATKQEKIEEEVKNETEPELKENSTEAKEETKEAEENNK